MNTMKRGIRLNRLCVAAIMAIWAAVVILPAALPH